MMTTIALSGIRKKFMIVERAISGQNTFKNTPEDDLDTFCDIISHLTSKYRPDFFYTFEISGPDFDEH